MASASGNSASRSRTNTKKSTSTKSTKRTSSGTKRKKTPARPVRENVDIAVKNEVMLIVIFAVAIFIFLCVIGLIHGAAATGISNIMFGLFGLLAYLVPVIVFLGFAFGISNKGNTVAVIKMVSSVVLIVLLGVLAYMLAKQETLLDGESIVRELYQTSIEHRAGGGVLFGSIAHGMYNLIGFGGTLFVVIVLGIICVVFITEKSFLSGVKKGGSYLIESAREDAVRMREYRESLREEYDDYEDYEEYEEPEYEEVRPKRSARPKAQKAEIPEKNVRRMDKRARGVASSSAVTLKAEKQQDIHEIVLLDEEVGAAEAEAFEDIKARPYSEVQYIDAINDVNEYGDSSPDGETYNEDAFDETAYVEPVMSAEAYVEETGNEDTIDEME